MFYVLEGHVRIGDGSGFVSRVDAWNAGINLMARRRLNYGCSRRNAGSDPCTDHHPKRIDHCRAWSKYTAAIDAAQVAKNAPGNPSGTDLVYGSGWHDSSVFVQHARNSDTDGYQVPGVGAGDLAVLTDHGRVDEDWKHERFIKIMAVDDRCATVRVTGRCLDGEKNSHWVVPIERVQPR